jgi:hypothetical protein
VFRFSGDRQDRICDAVSLAWEWFQRQPHAPPKSLAYYAVKHVRLGHQFGRSARSFDGPNPRGKEKAERGDFPLDLIGEDYDNPADLAALRIDFEDWQVTLEPRLRAILHGLLMGETTSELARQFGLSWGRISQIRRILLDSWQVHTT